MFLPPRASAALALTAAMSLLALAGCHSNTPASPGESASSSSPSASGAPASGALVAGQRVYQANGCARCHSLGGQGGRRGPDLSHVGADARHTPQWLAAYVKNPRQVDPGSRMPPFGDRIQGSDLTALGAYLAGQK